MRVQWDLAGPDPISILLGEAESGVGKWVCCSKKSGEWFLPDGVKCLERGGRRKSVEAAFAPLDNFGYEFHFLASIDFLLGIVGISQSRLYRCSSAIKSPV